MAAGANIAYDESDPSGLNNINPVDTNADCEVKLKSGIRKADASLGVGSLNTGVESRGTGFEDKVQDTIPVNISFPESSLVDVHNVAAGSIPPNIAYVESGPSGLNDIDPVDTNADCEVELEPGIGKVDTSLGVGSLNTGAENCSLGVSEVDPAQFSV